MQKTAKLAKAGGVMLTGVSLGIACRQIASATTQREKNDILVEAAGGFVAGVLYGLGSSLAVMLMATPVGWVGSLAIGVAGAASGYYVGRKALELYDLTGAKIDFVKQFGIGTICSPSRTLQAGGMPSFSSSLLSVL